MVCYQASVTGSEQIPLKGVWSNCDAWKSHFCVFLSKRRTGWMKANDESPWKIVLNGISLISDIKVGEILSSKMKAGSIGSPSNGWNHHHNFIDKCLHLLSRHVIRAMLIRLCFLSFIVFFMFFFSYLCWDIPLAAMPNKKLLMLRVGPGSLLNLYLSPITRHWSLRYLCIYIYIYITYHCCWKGTSSICCLSNKSCTRSTESQYFSYFPSVFVPWLANAGNLNHQHPSWTSLRTISIHLEKLDSIIWV